MYVSFVFNIFLALVLLVVHAVDATFHMVCPLQARRLFCLWQNVPGAFLLLPCPVVNSSFAFAAEIIVPFTRYCL